jgi:hypothetical protein
MKRAILFCLIFVAAGERPYAHHSFAATYIENETIMIEGDLVQFIFRNPHSYMQVNVKESDGKIVRWAAEWAGTSQLASTGVVRDSLKVGDHVVISGSPGRVAEDHRIRLITLRRPKDGFVWGTKPGEVVE